MRRRHEPWEAVRLTRAEWLDLSPSERVLFERTFAGRAWALGDAWAALWVGVLDGIAAGLRRLTPTPEPERVELLGDAPTDSITGRMPEPCQHDHVWAMPGGYYQCKTCPGWSLELTGPYASYPYGDGPPG